MIPRLYSGHDQGSKPVCSVFRFPLGKRETLMEEGGTGWVAAFPTLGPLIRTYVRTPVLLLTLNVNIQGRQGAMTPDQKRYKQKLHEAWRGLYDAAQLASQIGYDTSSDDLIGMARLCTAMQDDVISGEFDRGRAARLVRRQEARTRVPMARDRPLDARRTDDATRPPSRAKRPGSSPPQR